MNSYQNQPPYGTPYNGPGTSAQGTPYQAAQELGGSAPVSYSNSFTALP
jgi:hypothetical protein